MSHGIMLVPALRQVRRVAIALASVALLALPSCSVHAADQAVRSLIASQPPILLTTSGMMLQITPAMLAELPWKEIETTTPWTKGALRFSGPLLRDVISIADASGGRSRPTVRAKAYDDYWVEIPADDLLNANVIIAVLRDGRPLPRRDKGPYWIVYPLDSKPELVKHWRGRMLWQLKAIEIQ